MELTKKVNEINHKEASMIKAMVKVGTFLHFKKLKDFDFNFQENINKDQIINFQNHRFIHECKGIVFLAIVVLERRI